METSARKWYEMVVQGKGRIRTREYPQAVPHPKCPSAICHHEFKVRQVIYLGVFLPQTPNLQR